ncbi:hypothetical protein SAY86_015801 [Trapa natans]|uniref:Agenet domain-containing protein n=1 Tax=Trapa natans TaxID=22666 RepID=A0AAN7QVU2_TRANT|nr:hypothetical protein SAY86_015801 [Trapa natans]
MHPAVVTTFRQGDAIEICPDDDGFRGSWFTGTVIRGLSGSSSSNRRKVGKKPSHKYLVQFDNLFEDQAGTKKLKEEVEEWQLRPLLPREANRLFSLSDEVDAYYNDGWWEGTITEQLGQGMFEVYFRASKDSIQFKAEDLRLHREWINNAWVPPFSEEQQEKSPANDTKVAEGKDQIFKDGTMVEVSSDEDGYHGAWFSAKVVKALSEKKYIVEYQNLRNQDDMKLLLEEADILHIRPCPPKAKASTSFKLLEEVDALYNDGWWIGVISKVLGDSKFSVYFRDTNEEMDFHGSALRPHQEWIDGKWVIASQILGL